MESIAILKNPIRKWAISPTLYLAGTDFKQTVRKAYTKSRRGTSCQNIAPGSLRVISLSQWEETITLKTTLILGTTAWWEQMFIVLKLITWPLLTKYQVNISTWTGLLCICTCTSHLFIHSHIQHMCFHSVS